MNNGPLLFFGILVTLASSFWGLILAPQLQFGRQQPRLIEATGEYYPPQRPGAAEKGADVYRALGCVECHSQQVRQTGVHFDVWVTELTTNMSQVVSRIPALRPALTESDASKLLARLPARLAENLSAGHAQALAKQLTDLGAKAEPALVVTGSDIERNWGRRMSVAQDYLRDYPVQLGHLRLGPDLANYATRSPGTNQIYLHLFEPVLTMPGSQMPPYRFLFEQRTLAAGEVMPANALALPVAGKHKAGEVIIPKPAAAALVQYLLSLKAETPLYEAPVGSAPAATAANAPTNPGQ